MATTDLLDPTLKSQLGSLYYGGDYTGFNNLVSQNNISGSTLQNSFGLSDADMQLGQSQGLTWGTGATTPITGTTTPSPTTNTTTPQDTFTDQNKTDLTNLWTSGNISGLNDYISKNGYTSNQLANQFGLNSDNLNTLTSAGVTFGGGPASTTGSNQPIDTNTAQNLSSLWQSGNVDSLNQALASGKITSDQAAQTFGLNADNLAFMAKSGVNFYGATPNAATNPITPATAGAGVQNVYSMMNDPAWLDNQIHNLGNGALEFTDPTTGTTYLPQFNNSDGAFDFSGQFKGMAALSPEQMNSINSGQAVSVPLYDKDGNPTGETQTYQNKSNWFVDLIPYVIAAAATFGVASTIAGVGAAADAGAAAGAGAGAGTDAVGAAGLTAPDTSIMGANAAVGDSGGFIGEAPFTATPGATPLDFGGASGASGATDFSLANPASSGTGIQATPGTGLNLATTTGDQGIIASPGPGLQLAADSVPAGGLGLSPTIAGNALISGAGLAGGAAMGAGSLLGPAATAGTFAMSDGTLVPGFTSSGAPLTPIVDGGTGGGGVTTPVGGTTPNSPIDLNSLLKGLIGLGGGIIGGNQQSQAANNMLDWLKAQQAKIDGLYQPGSPEYNLLMQQMAAKDAAAGRNSQYGIRSIDLAAKIAEIKAKYTAQLTSGIAGNMQSAFNQNASSDSGLLASLGNLFGGSKPAIDLNSLFR